MISKYRYKPRLFLLHAGDTFLVSLIFGFIIFLLCLSENDSIVNGALITSKSASIVKLTSTSIEIEMNRLVNRRRYSCPFVVPPLTRTTIGTSGSDRLSTRSSINISSIRRRSTNQQSSALCMMNDDMKYDQRSFSYIHQRQVSFVKRHHRCFTSKYPRQTRGDIYNNNNHHNMKRTNHLLSLSLSTTSNDYNNELDSSERAIYQELKELSSVIQNHDVLYYTSGKTPQISDDEYDALTKREAEICKLYPAMLRRLEDESGLGSKATRYGGRVGPIVQNSDDADEKKVEDTKSKSTSLRKKIVHLENAPMQSLDNAMDATEVVQWLNRVRKILFKALPEENDDDNDNHEGEEDIKENQKKEKSITIIGEPKMDGLSLSLRYQLEKDNNGHYYYNLESGATRGDGKRGEDVTDAIMAITKNDRDNNVNENNQDHKKKSGMIPSWFMLDDKYRTERSNTYPQIVEVRGEIVLPKSTFHELVNVADQNDEESPSVKKSGFSNARNAASGILLRRKSQTEKTEEEINNTKALRESLRFYSYSIGFSAEGAEEISEKHYSDGEELRDLLQGMGFSLPNPSTVTSISLQLEREVEESDCKQLIDYHETIMNNREKLLDNEISDLSLFDFDIDGAVYKVSSTEDRIELGTYTIHTDYLFHLNLF
jgi:hypothetical protein